MRHPHAHGKGVRYAIAQDPLGTVDLVGELQAIEQLARNARAAIANGEAVNGNSALGRIELRARDAARYAREDELGAARRRRGQLELEDLELRSA